MNSSSSNQPNSLEKIEELSVFCGESFSSNPPKADSFSLPQTCSVATQNVDPVLKNNIVESVVINCQSHELISKIDIEAELKIVACKNLSGVNYGPIKYISPTIKGLPKPKTNTQKTRGRPRKLSVEPSKDSTLSPNLAAKHNLLLARQNIPASVQKQLPSPSFRKFNLSEVTGINVELNPYYFEEPFLRPEGHYLRTNEAVLEPRKLVEYDLDLEDKAWLEQLNNNTLLKDIPKEVPNAFEFIIDNLEKEWFSLSRKNDGQNQPFHISQPNPDAPCEICGESDCENSNAIVFCDGCDLAVHQDCYGVPYIPEGQWLCRKCMLSPANPVECIFCPNEGGAFKQTSDNSWAHLTCALWIPEVSFGNTVYMEPVEGLSRVPKSRRKLLCYLCKKQAGACIQCSFKTCILPFHVTCAMSAKLCMKYKVTKEGVSMRAFCFKHSPKDYKHQIKLEESQSPADNKSPTLKRPRSFSKDFSAQNEEGSKKDTKSARAHNHAFSTTKAVIPQQIYNKVLQGMGSYKIRKPSHFLTEVCKYWSLKKESCRGAPLIKRLHLEPWTASLNPLQTEEEKLAIYGTLKKVRSDLEKVRMLIELVRKRETCKLNLIRTQLQYWEAHFFPQAHFFREVLNRVIRLDTGEYFTQPVTKDQAPDYHDVIKDPMDLGTLTRMVNQHEIVDFNTFKDKLLLIYSNCRLYNGVNTVYHKAATRHHKRALEILEAASQGISQLQQEKPFKILMSVFDWASCFSQKVKELPSTPLVPTILPSSTKEAEEPIIDVGSHLTQDINKPNGSVASSPKKTSASAHPSKKTFPTTRSLSPPITRSKRLNYDSYDLRRKPRLKLRIKTNQKKVLRLAQTTSSPSHFSNNIKSKATAEPTNHPSPPPARPDSPKKLRRSSRLSTGQTSIIPFLSRSLPPKKGPRNPRASHSPDRFNS